MTGIQVEPLKTYRVKRDRESVHIDLGSEVVFPLSDY